MDFITLFATAAALSMDAFAVAVCKGLAMPKLLYKKAVIIGLWFGFFQASMPLIGYTLAMNFATLVEGFAHWIAFVLLAAIGANMIKESMSVNEDCADASVGFKSMLVLAVATSIDALVAGVGFAFMKTESIFTTVSLIGIITFLFSVVGVKIGNAFGVKYKSKAEIAGGVILIFIAFEGLVSHYIG